MKKFLSILILFLSCCLIFGFSKNKEKTYIGTIVLYGNDPFSYPVLKTEDGKKYSLKADKTVLNELKNILNKVEITGQFQKNKKNEIDILGAEDGAILVLSWELID